MSGEFQFPVYYHYPPYFTLQPVKETQQKQREMWKDLILRYCKHHRRFVMSTEETDDCPLWHNATINRWLSREARVLFIDDLVQQGNALWFDRGQRQALILWKTIPEWAAAIAVWARAAGMDGAVLTLDDMQHGTEVKGSELEGIHREALVRALKVLEGTGKARLFKGTGPEDEGVKFAAPL